MTHGEERYFALIAFLTAVLVASHASIDSTSEALFLNYLYWIIRIGVQAILFFLFRNALEKYFSNSLNFIVTSLLAILASHIPFVLAITAIDIVLGFPELGMSAQQVSQSSRINAFLLELFFLSDNHLAVCLLLSLPRLIMNEIRINHEANNQKFSRTILATLDPPLNGAVMWIEAQEHYVRIQTENDSRMVLARFSDILRELPNEQGLQVHRSHWVARAAIAEKQKSGQSLNLVLKSGDIVPVSRSFQKQVDKAV